MEKRIEFNRLKFIIKVELNYFVERMINGKCEHRVTINHLGDPSFYKEELCTTKYLEVTIQSLTDAAEKWANGSNPKSEEEILLESLGFTK